MPVSDYTPTVDDVAAAMADRLQQRWGGQAGTFDDTTRPTGTQVQGLIDKSVGLVASRIGNDLPNANLLNAARDVVVQRVALRIEVQYFGDQIRSGQSAWDQMKRVYDEDFAALIDAVADARAAGPLATDDDVEVGPGGMPINGFNRTRTTLIGMDTIW